MGVALLTKKIILLSILFLHAKNPSWHEKDHVMISYDWGSSRLGWHHNISMAPRIYKARNLMKFDAEFSAVVSVSAGSIFAVD